jgi:hypothetical protein
VLEDVAISNLTMRDISNAPIFIRLGARLRRPGAVDPGVVRHILIENVVADNVAADQGILIAGLPGHPVEDVVLAGLQIHFSGGGAREQGLRVVPELEKAYPEPGSFGFLPSWGIFARHVRNLQIRNLELRVKAPDARTAAWLEDARDVRLADVVLSGPASPPYWSLKQVAGLKVRDAAGLPDGEYPETGAAAPK